MSTKAVESGIESNSAGVTAAVVAFGSWVSTTNVAARSRSREAATIARSLRGAAGITQLQYVS